MLNYNEYLLESQFKKWETEILNESFDSVYDSIQRFLDKEYEVDTTKFETVVANLFKRFKSKLKVISIIVGLLISSYMGVEKVKVFIIE